MTEVEHNKNSRCQLRNTFVRTDPEHGSRGLLLWGSFKLRRTVKDCEAEAFLSWMNVISFTYLILCFNNQNPFQKTCPSSHEAPYCVPEGEPQGHTTEVHFCIIFPHFLLGLSEFVRCINPKLIFCIWKARKGTRELYTA